MTKVINIQKAREARKKKSHEAVKHDGFDPCSPDMTICGDCDGNRAKLKCPRLKEWAAKKERQ